MGWGKSRGGGGLGWALVNLTARGEERKATVKKGLGDKEGHLGFGDVDTGLDGCVEESMQNRLNCNTAVE